LSATTSQSPPGHASSCRLRFKATFCPSADRAGASFEAASADLENLCSQPYGRDCGAQVLPDAPTSPDTNTHGKRAHQLSTLSFVPACHEIHSDHADAAGLARHAGDAGKIVFRARHAGDAGKIVFRTPLRFVLCANKKSPDAKMQSFVNRVRVIS
jgi:hypothetical protein